MSIRALQALSLFEVPGPDLLVPVGIVAHIALAPDGKVVGVEQYATTGRRRAVMAAPILGRTSGIVPRYLVDPPEYVCGLSTVPKKGADAAREAERSLLKFQAFRNKHDSLVAKATEMGVRSPELVAVTKFLHDHDPKSPDKILALGLKGVEASGSITFAVGGRLVIEIEEVAQVLMALAIADVSDGKGLCMVSGEYTDIARSFMTVTGLPGTKSTGVPLLSNNISSAKPYRLSSDGTSGFSTLHKGVAVPGPTSAFTISAKVMLRQANALNYMRDAGRRRHYFQIGDAAYFVWGNPFVLAAVGEALVAPVSDDKRERKSKETITAEVEQSINTLRSPYTGRLEEHGADVFMLGLTGAVGRVSFTYWHETSSTTMQDHLLRWADELAWGASVSSWGVPSASGAPWRPSLFLLQTLLVPAGGRVSSAISATRGKVGRQLLEAACAGRPIPASVQQAAVQALSRDEFKGGSANGARMALCGLLGVAVLRDTQLTREQIVSHPAYALGRAFALTAHLQSEVFYREKRDLQPPILRLEATIARMPQQGFNMLWRAWSIYLRSRFLSDFVRGQFARWMNDCLATVPTTAFPKRATAADTNLFYLGMQAEQRRIQREIIQPRIDKAAAAKLENNEDSDAERPPAKRRRKPEQQPQPAT